MRGRPVVVGERLRVARDARLHRRLGGGRRRARSESGQGRAAEQLGAGVARGARAVHVRATGREGVPARADQPLEGAVAVEAGADAVEPGERVPELLVVGRARGGGAVLQLDVAARDEHLAEAAAERVELVHEARLRRHERPDRRRRGHEVLGEVAELGRRDEQSRLGDPGQRGGDGGRQLVHGRDEVEREAGRRSERRVQRREGAVGGGQRGRQLRHGRVERGRLRRERLERHVEVGDQALQVALALPERGADPPQRGDRRETSWGSSPASAWVTIVELRNARGARRAASLSACAAVLPRTIGSCVTSWAGVGTVRERSAVGGEQLLQVGARVAVERAQHLVELHRVGGLGDGNRRARLQDRRGRGCPAGGPRRSCPPGRCAGGSSSSCRNAAAAPRSRGSSSRPPRWSRGSG